MKVSVVIPLYNKAPFIKAAVSSALTQTTPVHEVIVVDDGSTDEGPRKLEAVADPRLRILHQSNAGVSAARNRGIAAATGDWIAFLDADDWYHPEFIACLHAAHSRFPSADILAAAYSRSDEASPNIFGHAPTEPEVELIEDLRVQWMRRPLFCSSSVAISSRRLRSLRPLFRVGESEGEDLDLWFRASDESLLAFVPRPLAVYRVAVSGSLSSAKRSRRLPPFLTRMRRDAGDGTIPPHRARSALWFVAQQEITFARQALIEGRRLEAIDFLARAFRDGRGVRWMATLLMALAVPSQDAQAMIDALARIRGKAPARQG